MKKSELLARIVALEAQVAALQARPYPYVSAPSVFGPIYPSPTVYPSTFPITTTCVTAASSDGVIGLHWN
jgi:hypothetical protein